MGLPQLVARVRGRVGPNAAGILTFARRSCRPARLDLRNRKSARAAFQCTALIAVITAVNPVQSELSYPPRRARTIITDGKESVKIKVILLVVSRVVNGHYASNRLYGSTALVLTVYVRTKSQRTVLPGRERI